MFRASDPSERLIDDPTVLHRVPMVLVLFAACLGVLVDGWITSGAIVRVVLAIVVLGGAGAFLWFRDGFRLNVALLWIVFLTFVGFACRHRIDESSFRSASISQFLASRPQPTIVEGAIDGRPEIRRATGVPWASDAPQWRTSFDLRLSQIRVENRWQDIAGRLRVMIDGDFSSLPVGQSVVVAGAVEGPAQPSNPGSMDRRNFLRSAGVHGYMDAQSLLASEPSDELKPIFLGRLAQRSWETSRERLTRSVDPDGPHGALALALVLGERHQVDRQMRDKLIATGTAHLLSVSGMHLAIVVGLASALTIFVGLPWRVRLILMFGVCVGYAAITGGRPPVIRAAILVLVFLLSLTTKRTTQPLNTLAFAG
ncbi:MAG: ComEC/Rec2 family competence protein, partial [Planctomycetota bacterium]